MDLNIKINLKILMKVQNCVFCNIESNNFAPIVYQDEDTIAFIDPRQFHPGHTLIIPKNHFNDIRDIDSQTGLAIINTLSLITKAVADCFSNNGISIWQSIGPAAFQEISHMHFHVHPRKYNDNFLRVYPEGGFPGDSAKEVLEERANILKTFLPKFNQT
jgi:histidine triad (HIT) family protein